MNAAGIASTGKARDPWVPRHCPATQPCPGAVPKLSPPSPCPHSSSPSSPGCGSRVHLLPVTFHHPPELNAFEIPRPVLNWTDCSSPGMEMKDAAQPPSPPSWVPPAQPGMGGRRAERIPLRSPGSVMSRQQKTSLYLARCPGDTNIFLQMQAKVGSWEEASLLPTASLEDVRASDRSLP